MKNNPYIKKYQFGGEGDPEDPIKNVLNYGLNPPNKPMYGLGGNPYQQASGYSWGSGMPNQSMFTQLAPDNKEYAVHTTVPSVTTTSNDQAIKDMEFKGQYSVVPKVEPTTYDKLKNKYQSKGWESMTENEKSLYTDMYENGSAMTMMSDNVLERTVTDEYWDKIQSEVDKEQGILDMQNAVRGGTGKFASGLFSGFMYGQEIVGTPLALALEALSGRGDYYSALPNLDRTNKMMFDHFKDGNKYYDEDKVPQNEQLSPSTALGIENPVLSTVVDVAADFATGKIGNIGKNVAKNIVKDVISSQSLNPNTSDVVMSGFGLPNFNKGYQSFKESNTGRYIIDKVQKAKDAIFYNTKKAKNEIAGLEAERKDLDSWIHNDYRTEVNNIRQRRLDAPQKVQDYFDDLDVQAGNRKDELGLQLQEARDSKSLATQEAEGLSYEPENNAIVSTANNPFTAVVTTGKGQIPDFVNGDYVDVEVTLPSEGKKYTADNTSTTGLKSETTNVHRIDQNYIDTQRRNVRHVEQVMVPGSKAYGSAVGVSDAGLLHLSNDIDFLITESDFNKHLNNNSAYQDNGTKGPARKFDLFNGKYKSIDAQGNIDNPGEMDFNVIHENPDGTVRPVYKSNADGSKRSLEVELYRQFFPDDFFRESQLAIQQNRDINIPITAKELLDKVDGKIKTIIDAYEAGAFSTTNARLSHKQKHLLRPDVYINYGDVDVVAKGQEAYIKSLVGEKGTLGHTFNSEDFADVNTNKKILEEISFIGDIDRVANDPKRMQLALNDFYINSSTFSRVVTHNTDLNIVFASMTEWSPQRPGAGYSQRGHGLNTTKLGSPIAGVSTTGGEIKGTLQYNLNANTENPLKYVQDIKKKTLASEALSPDDMAQANDIIDKMVPAQNIDRTARPPMRTNEDIIRFPFKATQDGGNEKVYDYWNFFRYNNFPANPNNVMNEISDKTGIVAVTRMADEDDIVGNAPYASILKKFDEASDALLYTSGDIAVQPKSFYERQQYWKSLPKQRTAKALASLDEFNKFVDLLNGGMAKLDDRIKTIEDKISILEQQKAKMLDDENYDIDKAIRNLTDERDAVNARQIESWRNQNKIQDKIYEVQKTRRAILTGLGVSAGAGFATHLGLELNKQLFPDLKKEEKERSLRFREGVKNQINKVQQAELEHSVPLYKDAGWKNEWNANEDNIQGKYKTIENFYDQKTKDYLGQVKLELKEKYMNSFKDREDLQEIEAIFEEEKPNKKERSKIRTVLDMFEEQTPKNRYGGQNPYMTTKYKYGGPIDPVDPEEENKMMQRQINSILSGKPMNTGITMTKLNPDEEYTYQQWAKGLTPNLQGSMDDKNYDMRGAWQVGEQPELFYYDNNEFMSAHPIDVNQQGSIYEPHLFSRNPFTGKSLKGPNHPSFMHALEGDIKAGGKVKMDLKTGDMYTYEKGGNIEHSTVEIERSERVYTPDGKLIMETPADAPTHEEGGVKVTLPAGSLVFPKKYYKALDSVNGIWDFKNIAKVMLDNAEKAYLRGEPYSSGGKRQ